MPSKNKINRRWFFIILSGLLLGIVIGICVYIFLLSGEKKEIIGIENYRGTETYHGYGNLCVFPENITTEDERNEYYFLDHDMFMDPECQIYLSCYYDETAYNKEVSRLENLSYELNNNRKTIIKNTDLFSDTAYISMYDWSSCYEYAIVQEEHKRIIYVFVQNIPRWKIKFDRYFLPERFTDRQIGNYSMYAQDGYFETIRN